MSKNKDDIFISQRFKGSRFDNGRLPLDVLDELKRLERIILDVARDIYKKNNSERQRLPSGFLNRFKLELGDVKKGSAIACLKRVESDSNTYDQLSLIGSEQPDEFESAKDVLLDAIQAMNDDQELPAAFDKKYWRHFSSFGRSLKEGETMALETGTGSTLKTAEVTSSTRSKFLRLLGENYESDVEIFGTLISVDTSGKKFVVESDEYGQVNCTLAERFESEILETHKIYKIVGVRVQGTGTFQPDGGLVNVSDVEDVQNEEIGPNLDSRLQKLAALEDGWYFGKGVSPEKDLINFVQKVVREIAYKNIPFPHVFPTAEGGVRVEWSFGDKQVDVEVEFEPDIVFLLAHNRNDDTWDDKEIPRSNEEEVVNELHGFITSFLSKS